MFDFIFGAIKSVLGIATKVKAQYGTKRENEEMIKYLVNLNILETITPLLKQLEKKESEIDVALKGNLTQLTETITKLQGLMEELEQGAVAQFIKAQSVRTRYQLVYSKLTVTIQSMTLSAVLLLPELSYENKAAIEEVGKKVDESKSVMVRIEASMEEGFSDLKDVSEEIKDAVYYLKNVEEERQSKAKKSDESKGTVLTSEDINLFLNILRSENQTTLEGILEVYGVTALEFKQARDKFPGDPRMVLITSLNLYTERVFEDANRYKLIQALENKEKRKAMVTLAKKWGIILVKYES